MGFATSNAPVGPGTDLDFSFLPGNVPSPEQPDTGRKRRKRANARTKTPEQVYATLIKEGVVRVVRRKGKPPLIVWV